MLVAPALFFFSFQTTTTEKRRVCISIKIKQEQCPIQLNTNMFERNTVRCFFEILPMSYLNIPMNQSDVCQETSF